MVTSLPGYLLSRVDRSRTDDSRAWDARARMGFGLPPLALRAPAGHAERVVLRMVAGNVQHPDVRLVPGRQRSTADLYQPGHHCQDDITTYGPDQPAQRRSAARSHGRAVHPSTVRRIRGQRHHPAGAIRTTVTAVAVARDMRHRSSALDDPPTVAAVSSAVRLAVTHPPGNDGPVL